MQFIAGEKKTAEVTMRNPTQKGLDYTGYMYMGTDLAIMAEVPFSLGADQEKMVSFPVTMPSVPGTYPVHIEVFSEGRNIALYRATEDIAIILPYPKVIIESVIKIPDSDPDPRGSYYDTGKGIIEYTVLYRSVGVRDLIMATRGGEIIFTLNIAGLGSVGTHTIEFVIPNNFYGAEQFIIGWQYGYMYHHEFYYYRGEYLH